MSTKTQIDLQLLLPHVAGSHDRCVERLTDALKAKSGIDTAHLVEASNELCIHFDPTVISVQDVRRLAETAGIKLQERYGHLHREVGAMHASRSNLLTDQLMQVPGVLDAYVSADGSARVEFDRDRTSEAEVTAAVGRIIGAEIAPARPPHKHEHDHEHEDGHDHSHGNWPFGAYSEIIFVGLCGITLLLGWQLQDREAIPSHISLILLIASYFFGGFFALQEAMQSIRAGRFQIDTLMLVAAAGAAALGKWTEGALLLFLFSLGHALENYAMARAKRAIEALGELVPRTAMVRRNGKTEQIGIEDIRVSDIVIVKPNERLPVDGFVTKGDTSVNQAPITGESVPVDKHPVADPAAAAAAPDKVDKSSRVFAGTINGAGAIEVQVTRASGDSTLARVAQMVREAKTNRSPTQEFTNRVERIFVPAVLGIAVLLLFAGLVVNEPFSDSFYRSMAVLVAASPCALAIATPSAVLSGIARAARGGVLIKGGGPLEHLGRIKSIAFDKTGTLTEGTPKLIDVVAAEGSDEAHLLKIAVAVESLSDHPLAAAVVKGARDRLPSLETIQASAVKSITGRGVEARIDDALVHVGKPVLFSEIAGEPMPPALASLVAELESAGRTVMVVRAGEQYLGALGLMDAPRKNAREVVAALRKTGIRRMIMLTGDNQKVADSVAREIGLDEARGDLMPNDKVETIRRLRAENHVAMVGDGVNDAPAMASATVGIAMGAAGSDVALETADVALMADALETLPFAVSLSRATSRIIQQNLWISLGIVALLVPSTIFGLSIGAAVAFHEGSTIVVVVNALRLLAYSGDKLGDRP